MIIFKIINIDYLIEFQVSVFLQTFELKRLCLLYNANVQLLALNVSFLKVVEETYLKMNLAC